MYVIVDGHPAHRAKRVKEYIASTNGMLKLFFLPPYAPHLNPDEQIWAHAKRHMSRRGVENIEQMKRMAIAALRRIHKLPRLIHSFFQQPECQYAAA